MWVLMLKCLDGKDDDDAESYYLICGQFGETTWCGTGAHPVGSGHILSALDENLRRDTCLT